MLTLDVAQGLALQFVLKDFDLSKCDDTIQIISNRTESFKNGWVFFYNSEKFLKTGDFDYMLMGNKPVFVNIFSGVATYLRIDVPFEQQVM